MSNRKRTQLEGALALLFGLAAVVTAIWPEWIEELTGWEPDGGSGAMEWAMVAGLGVVALALAALARRDVVRSRGEGRRTTRVGP